MSSSIPTPPRPLRVCLLGSTGSIGVQTLEVCEEQGSRVEVVGLAAGRNAERLFEQAAACGARDLVLRDEEVDESLGDEGGRRLRGVRAGHQEHHRETALWHWGHRAASR